MHVLHAATPALEGLLAITLGTWGFELPTGSGHGSEQ